ncbi:MAG TPA: glucosamine-6-phosphate deaminase, partial [Chitinophagaceae bacterium]|nr:glucosamine-6-phosphate deaminase [Chitinophagaceae bacterium]
MPLLAEIKNQTPLAMISTLDAMEKIPVSIFSTSRQGSAWVAAEIAALIRQKQSEGKPCVLGLATGSTPISLYAELVRLHREDGLSFANVVTFNLDEYFPIEREAYQSYWSFMHRHLLQHVDIKPENIHIPDGSLPKEAIKAHCQA